MQGLSDLVLSMAESATIKMAQTSRELKAKGKDIISLSLGEPDFKTPDHICNAAKKAIDDGITHYPPVPGFPELREAVVERYKKDFNISYKPSQVVVSTGAKQSIINVLMSIINPDDEVIVPSPYWVSYSAMVNISGGKMVNIETTVEDDFKISPEQLEKAIGPNTKAFLFCSPSNPTGSVYSKEELAALAEVFNRHPEVIIISDEIYDYINFSGQPESMASFEDLHDRLVIINGVSKSFAMTGWRIGFMIGPEKLAKACTKIQGQFTSGASGISQMAALEAVKGDKQPTYNMRDAFEKRRNLMLDKLSQLINLKISTPEGAFYLFPDISGYFGKSYKEHHITGSEDLSMFLLEIAEVATVPGIAFGNDDCIRLSYAASTNQLEEAANRMIDALQKLK